jgi:hypothetical protein
LASDDFNRANGSGLGANWTIGTGWTGDIDISGNAAANAGSAPVLDAYNNATFANDQFSQCTITAINGVSDEGMGPAVRVATGARTGYFLQCNTVEVKLYRVIAGAFVQIGADFGAAAISDVFKLTVSGGTLECFKNGVSQGTRADANIASGNAGLWSGVGSGAHTAKVDDWSGGDLSAPAAQVPYQPNYQMAPILAQ